MYRKWCSRAVAGTTDLYTAPAQAPAGRSPFLWTLKLSSDKAILSTCLELSSYLALPAASGRSPALHESSFDQLGWEGT